MILRLSLFLMPFSFSCFLLLFVGHGGQPLLRRDVRDGLGGAIERRRGGEALQLGHGANYDARLLVGASPSGVACLTPFGVWRRRCMNIASAVVTNAAASNVTRHGK